MVGDQEVVTISKEPRVNERIRAREVRLVDPEGGQIGVKSIEEARWLADQLGLDLVEVAPEARPPVVRLMDYGKFKYEQSVKAREARKKQSRTVIKEVQFRPKIGKSDFEVKAKRVERFLRDGDKVKCVMRFRGREVTHPEIGREILQRLVDYVGDLAVIEQSPRIDGRQMVMVLGPSPKAREEAAERREAAGAAREAEAEAAREAKAQDAAGEPPTEPAETDEETPEADGATAIDETEVAEQETVAPAAATEEQ